MAADSGETVTTELQPGRNLVGWTEAISEAIPQLERVLLANVDIGGGFWPSQYWMPPNRRLMGVEAENVGDRTIAISLPEICP